MPVFLKAICIFQVMIYTLKCLITFNFASMFNYVYYYIIRKTIELLMFSPYWHLYVYPEVVPMLQETMPSADVINDIAVLWVGRKTYDAD